MREQLIALYVGPAKGGLIYLETLRQIPEGQPFKVRDAFDHKPLVAFNKDQRLGYLSSVKVKAPMFS